MTWSAISFKNINVNGDEFVLPFPLEQFEKTVSQYPDNKKAWERACDLLIELDGIPARSIDYCESPMEYFTKIYPAAVKASEIIHTMSTVPVYVLVEDNPQAGGETLVTVSQEGVVVFENVLPVFFSREDAEKALREGFEGSTEGMRIVRIPFMLLIDKDFGIFGDNAGQYLEMLLCYFKKGKPWVRINKWRIIMMLLDACRALRSYYDYDILSFFERIEQMNAEMLQNAEQHSQYVEWAPGKGKPPVS